MLLTVLLLAYLLAADILPAAAPGAATSAYWLAAIPATALFVASLLAHELAHAALARRFGLRVRSITLWLLGGAAVFEDEPPTPRTDALIAGIGPAVSAALSVVFLAAAIGSSAIGMPSLLVAGCCGHGCGTGPATATGQPARLGPSGGRSVWRSSRSAWSSYWSGAWSAACGSPSSAGSWPAPRPPNACRRWWLVGSATSGSATWPPRTRWWPRAGGPLTRSSITSPNTTCATGCSRWWTSVAHRSACSA